MTDQPHRDDAFDRELTRAFAADAARVPPDPHVDGERVAAWLERGLDAAEMQRVDAHLADCARCRALAATVVRLTPDAARPEPWWRSLRLGWLVPAGAAAAAAVVLWVAWPARNTPDALDTRTGLQARLEAPAGPVAPPPVGASRPPAQEAAPAATAPNAARRQTADSSNATAKAALAREDAPARKAEAFAPVVAPAIPPAAARAESEERKALADAAADRPAAALGRVAPAQEATAGAGARERDNRSDAAAAPAAAPAAPRAPFAAQAARSLSQIGVREVVSADGRGRWRWAQGRIEYAAGQGAPWALATAPNAEDVAAGSAPAGTVCWLVGRAGLVLRSTDGLRFVRVTAPAPADVVSVTAVDAASATVTTADGRRFRTVDQGVTWPLLP